MFYEVFMRLCSQYGKAPSTVCRELGIAPNSPKYWKEGQTPRPSTIKKVADYFGVDVSWFDQPFPEAPTPEPIPVHVITTEEAMMTPQNAFKHAKTLLSDGWKEYYLQAPKQAKKNAWRSVIDFIVPQADGTFDIHFL